MDYEDALNWIMSFWEPGRPKPQEKALRALKVPRMRTLLERIGSPHLKYPSILIAGTKGKGSTAAFIAEGLRAAGYRVGRYTQPHLIDWRERTWVDGRSIEPHDVASLVEKIKVPVEELHRGMGELGGLTTYEVGTALTLAYFADQKIDVAVLEIGIGGRLDALNAVDPVLSVVTSISLDHTSVLGETLAEIAEEKAGIFRQGRVAISAPQHADAEKVLLQVAMQKGTYLYLVGKDWKWRESSEVGEGILNQAGDGNNRPVEHGAKNGSSNLIMPSSTPLIFSGEQSGFTLAGRTREPSLDGRDGREKAVQNLQVSVLRTGFQESCETRGEREGARDSNLRTRGNGYREERNGTIDIIGPEGVIAGVRIPLLGDHQRDNATVAAAALQLMGRDGFRNIEAEVIRRGLASVEWPGRIQLLRTDPLVVVDAAHNEDSARRLIQTVRKHYNFERLLLVFGASSDKDIAGMARTLAPEAHYVVVTASGHRRAADVDKLRCEFARFGEVRVESDPRDALLWAIEEAKPKDLVLVTGSVFLAGRAIQILKATP